MDEMWEEPRKIEDGKRKSCERIKVDVIAQDIQIKSRQCIFRIVPHSNTTEWEVTSPQETLTTQKTYK